MSFEPALDEVFGVTNNKQSATAFSDIKLSEIAEDENVDVTQLELDMKNDDDPRRHVIKVAKQVTDLISAIRKSLASQTEGIKAARKFKKKDNAASAASSTTSNDGGVGESDKKAEKLTPAQKEKELSKELDLDNEDMDEEDKKVILKEWLEAEKVIFASAPMRASNALFDVSQPGGKLKITINKSHPAYKSFIGELEENNGTGFDILKLIFASWARLEDTLGDSDEEKERYENLRMKWGGGVSEMIKAYQGNK